MTLGIYFAIRVADLTIREVWGHAFEGSLASFMFLLEFIVGLVVPLVMLSVSKVRESAKGLLMAASLAIFGVVLNRVNAFIIAYDPPYETQRYVPSVGEFAVTIGFAAALVLIYRLFALNLPIIAQRIREGRPSKPKAAPEMASVTE